MTSVILHNLAERLRGVLRWRFKKEPDPRLASVPDVVGLAACLVGEIGDDPQRAKQLSEIATVLGEMATEAHGWLVKRSGPWEGSSDQERGEIGNALFRLGTTQAHLHELKWWSARPEDRALAARASGQRPLLDWSATQTLTSFARIIREAAGPPAYLTPAQLSLLWAQVQSEAKRVLAVEPGRFLEELERIGRYDEVAPVT